MHSDQTSHWEEEVVCISIVGGRPRSGSRVAVVSRELRYRHAAAGGAAITGGSRTTAAAPPPRVVAPAGRRPEEGRGVGAYPSYLLPLLVSTLRVPASLRCTSCIARNRPPHRLYFCSPAHLPRIREFIVYLHFLCLIPPAGVGLLRIHRSA